MPRRKNSKAAWRALDDDVARTARAGPTAAETAATLSNDALFYVDKAAAGTPSGSSGGSKRARARARALKIDAACEKEPATREYPTPVPVRAGKANPPPSRANEATRRGGATDATRGKIVKRAVASVGKAVTKGATAAMRAAYDVWSVKAPKSRGVNKEARKLTASTTSAKAVEVSHPGTSFNPPKDAREDVVAVALAKEFKAKQKKYLDPVTVPVSNAVAEQNLVNELFFESGFGDDESSDGDESGDDAHGHADGERAKKKVVADKFSKTKRNKMKRRAEAEALEEENRKAKQLRRDLSNLKALNQEIEREEEERQARLARRNAVRAERRAAQPARLGKHRHEADLAPVRFADELDGGSLRTLKSYGESLLRDRLKSYERRELIEPRKKVIRKRSKQLLKYEPGAKGERELEFARRNAEDAERIKSLRAAAAAARDDDDDDE